MTSERVQRRINRLLDEAEQAADQGEWGSVRERARAVLAVDSGNSDATAFLAMADEMRPADDDDTPPTPRPPEATADQPTSFAGGRYKVKEFLGEGGKKRVYLAHDNTLDRDVAFALIKSEGFTDTDRTRITREAQAMGRLGDHPSIMPIHDLGTESGQPYMVLPVMTGGDVQDLIEEAEEHRLPLEQALEITKSVCRGLEFAHEQGIVHRDLKPGNVWLTADGAARIGDFGLAVALDVSRLTQEGTMVGTAAYMPPEQATGGDITPRADLYSLGAMLYEMVTGRPPFLGDDQIAIIGQHINTPPVAPTWHSPACPKPLEALIMRLLAKNPTGRPESATDVLAALDAIDLASLPSPLAGEGQGEGEGPQPGSLDSMAGGVFVGRHREMDQLKAALEDALGGRGRMLTLVGEPGIGKTRTSSELATYAGLRNAQVLWGRCYEGGGAPPYWPWVQAIRNYIRERDPEKLRSEMGSGASVIAEVVPDVRERLPDVQSPPALDDPESARFRLFDSITAFLKSASMSQPLVLVLDDLHWADKPSLMLLEFVAAELANSRLLLLGTYRDVELNRRHPLSQSLAELNRSAAGGLERVLLRGLSHDDVARFIEIAAGVAPPRALVNAVHTQTEGNPLFVTEVVRLLVQEDALAEENLSKRQRWSVRIPEGVREVIGRRLDRLSERCNDLLTTAAVIGRQFELRALVSLFGDEALAAEDRQSEDRLLEVIEEALDARVIEELRDAVGRYQFTHALIEQTLVDELSTTRRVRLHARVAEALEGIYGDDAEANAAELVHHYAEAETLLGPDKLVLYGRSAGFRALESLAFEEARSIFERCLNSLAEAPVDDLVAELRLGAGEACVALRETDAALSHLGAAFDHYQEAGSNDVVGQIAATNFLDPDGIMAMMPLMERALGLLPEGSIERARVLAQYGRALGQFAGDYKAGIEALEESIRIAEESDDRSLAYHAHTMAANISQWQPGVTESRVSHARQALKLSAEIDQPLDEAQVHGILARNQFEQGDLDGAEDHVRSAIASAERSRIRERISTVCGVGHHIYISVGKWKEAQRLADRAYRHSVSRLVIQTSTTAQLAIPTNRRSTKVK